MDYPDFIVCSFMGNTIGLKRVKADQPPFGIFSKYRIWQVKVPMTSPSVIFRLALVISVSHSAWLPYHQMP